MKLAIHNQLKENEDIFLSDPSFWKNGMVRTLLGVSAFLLLISFGILWYFVGKRETPVVLHYNVYFGVDVIGEWWEAYFVPFVGLLFFLLHTMLSRYLFVFLREKVLSFGVLLSLVLLEAMVALAAGAVALVNY